MNQIMILLAALARPGVHALAALSSARNHGQWFETLPDAIEGGTELRDAGYTCDCGECDSQNEPREMVVYRVDFDADDDTRQLVQEADEQAQLCEHFSWHGFTIAHSQTVGEFAMNLVQGARIVARIPAEKEEWVQYV